MDVQEEQVRLLAILVRLQLGNQADAIRELSKSDFGPTRIAQLLGTTPGTAAVTIAKQKKATQKRAGE